MKWTLLLVFALVPAAGAVEEADAPSIDDRIERVWHEPAVPMPEEQWRGYLQLTAGHNVTAVSYQICRVGLSCFAPPTPAVDEGDGLWSFDTNDYGPNGEPVAWGINQPGQSDGDWRVGVQYFLSTAEHDAQPVPEGLDVTGPECADVPWETCAETHYFAFTMPGRDANKEAHGVPLAAILVALTAILLRRR